MKRSPFRRKNKYGAIATYIDGIKWPSQLQAGHYQELKMLQAGKIIKDLDWEFDMPLDLLGERLGFYRADFIFFHIGRNRSVVLESKGKRTPLFDWKWKHVKIQYRDQYDFELATEKSLCRLINSET